MIIIDSGLGGISVVRAFAATHPGMKHIYCADTAGFPYGKREAADICQRAEHIVRHLTTLYPNQPVVLACNTLSTLCLDHLRKTFTTSFIGTVPAVKTAASISQSRRFTLLATPNTAYGHYSQSLINEFARDCIVDTYGAPNLAMMAEAMLLGETIDPAALQAELRPAFCNDGFGKTDSIVLGCTHYPLIVDALKQASPWPVTFIDSSEAIAQRALTFAAPPLAESIAYVTSLRDVERYAPIFTREGFAATMPLTLS